MISRGFRGAFEHALYLRLEGLPWRAAAVESAVDGLSAGFEGPATARLAGADDDDDDELTKLFFAAAREIGVALPAPADERVWRLRRTERLEREGRAVRSRTPDQVFEDRLYLLQRRLSEMSRTSAMAAFLRHLAVVTDGYDRWLRQLDELAVKVADRDRGPVGRTVLGLLEILRAQAYGATTAAHLAGLSKLLADVDGL